MAAPAKFKHKQKLFSFSFSFEGGLQSCVRADLTNELLKYFLYERQQIPIPFDQIKHEMKTQNRQTNVNNSHKPPQNRLQIKKTEDAVKNMEEIVKQVKHAFEVCPEIVQVAVVLGATPVSPKEIYVIQFPPLNPEADNLSRKEAVKSLFRQLITHDPLGQVKAIPLTNMTVLLNAPRNSPCFSGFLPKCTYKIPNRGNQFHFNLLSSTDNPGSQDLSRDFSMIDLSGFEPLEPSLIDSPMSEVRSSTNSDSSTSLSADYVCIDSEHDIEIVDDSDCDVTPKNLTSCSVTSDKTCDMSQSKNSDTFQETNMLQHNETPEGSDSGIHSLTEHEYIWFQSPVVVKGFKQKTVKHSGSNDFM